MDWKVDKAGLAWAPKGGLAIAVPQGLQEIQWEEFLSQLGIKLELVVENEDYGEGRYRRMWQQLTAQPIALDEDDSVTDHPMTQQFQDYLMEMRDLREEDFPMKIEPSEEAKEELSSTLSCEAFLDRTFREM